MKISGKRQAYIGIGGGSDCVQTSILGLLNGQDCCAISIRQSKLGSSVKLGMKADKRRVENHGGEVGAGVYRITPETIGTGRFLENIPAAYMPSYLIIDYQDGRLSAQMEMAIDDFGGVDTVIAVDTGGDALYRTGFADETLIDTTPDQDLASLLALQELRGMDLYSIVIAKGIDSPDYADEILQLAKASFHTLTEDQIARTLALYKDVKLDGTCDKRYGKTPYVWQAALQGKRGKHHMPLPYHVINHPTNPWNPVVDITDEMAGFYMMDLQAHVKAITSAPTIEKKSA